MAMGAMSVTVPALVAAAGICFFDKSHSKAQELSGSRASIGKMVAKGKQEVKEDSTEMPKLAPQLDGLHCFETLISH